MAFNPIFNSFATKPKSQYFSYTLPLAVRQCTTLFARLKANMEQLLRDNFTIPTWLMLGASLQGLVCLLPYRNIALVAPVVLVLSFQSVRTILMAFGLFKNSYMDGVIDGRSVPVYPNNEGQYEKPADSQVCAIMLAVRSNHPLGIFAEGYKEIGDRFASMIKELDNNATAKGYLGSSAWLSATDRTASSEFMSMVYFDSPESLHNFSHGPIHTDSMEWWQRTIQKHSYLAIMHEVYAAPKNSWEGVYINYHPTGLGRTNKEVTVDGKTKVWMSPLVQGKGKLNYSKGRMGRPFGEKEWLPFENTLTADEK